NEVRSGMPQRTTRYQCTPTRHRTMLCNKRRTPGFPEVIASTRKAETDGPKPPRAIRDSGKPNGAQISQKIAPSEDEGQKEKQDHRITGKEALASSVCAFSAVVDGGHV